MLHSLLDFLANAPLSPEFDQVCPKGQVPQAGKCVEAVRPFGVGPGGGGSRGFLGGLLGGLGGLL